jgi:hypothetical protein
MKPFLKKEFVVLNANEPARTKRSGLISLYASDISTCVSGYCIQVSLGKIKIFLGAGLPLSKDSPPVDAFSLELHRMFQKTLTTPDLLSAARVWFEI